MSVRDIEFIQMVDIKAREEDLLKLGKSDNVDDASASMRDAVYLRANKTRYGEVFMSEPDRLLLICCFCDEVHATMQQFGEHIHEKHCGPRNVGSEKDMLGVKIEEPQVNVKDSLAVEEVLELVDKGEFESSHEDAASSKAEDDVDESCEESSNQDSDSDNEPLTEKVKKAKLRARKPTDSDSDYEPTTKKTNKATTQPGMKRGPVTKEDLFCRRCNRQYKHLGSFTAHLKKIHESKKPTLHCIYCDKEFPTEEELGDHKRTHDRLHPFQCPHCPKSFSARSTRQYHINSHLGALPYMCSKCPKAFALNSNLRQHILNKHGLVAPGSDGVSNPLNCEICGKKFIHQSTKDMHVRSHTGEKPFQCELCGRKFRLNGLLKEHMKRHKNERNYECKVCGKSFYSNRMLNNHQVVHSTEKPFECEDCGKTFSRQLTLKLHRKIHSDVYQYSCNICGKQFKQSSGLYSHKKTHEFGISEYGG